MHLDDLIECCIKAIKKFNPVIEGPDSFISKFMRKLTKDQNERMFIRQIFYGFLEKRDFLKATTKAIFKIKPSSTNIEDEILYSIFIYMTVFRMDELSLDDFKSLVLSQDYLKMNELFDFLLDEDTIKTTLKKIWDKIYDPTYVNDKLLHSLLKTANDVEDLLDFLYEKTRNSLNELNKEKENKKEEKKEGEKKEEKKEEEEEENEEEDNLENDEENEYKEEIEETERKGGKTLSQILRDKKRTMRLAQQNQNKKQPLIIKPFNLSENKPRKLKEPKEIQTTFEKLPKLNYNKTNLANIEENRIERLEKIRKEIKEKYNIKPFEFASEKRPTNINQIREEVEKKFESTLQFNNKYVNPDIDYSKCKGDVKYNEAGLFREEFNINRNKKNEENELKRKLIEKTDSSEYERYLSENRERDNILNMQKVEKRKLELGMVREAAVSYRVTRMLKNRVHVLEHKKQEELNLKRRDEKKKKEIAKKRELVLQIENEHENIYKNKEKREKENKENYKNYRNEFNILNLISKQEEKILRDRRDDLIRQIRELEKLPVKRISGFDPSETPGYGLLEEMSIIELKERLDIQKKMHEDEIKSKREENKLKMNERTDEMIERANFIMTYRDKMRNEREIKKQLKLDEIKSQEELKRQIHEQNVFEVKNKLDLKREKLRKDDENFMKKIHELSLQRQFLKQGRSVVEERIFRTMEDGMENKVNNRQNQDLFDQQKKDRIKWIDLKLRYKKNLEEVNRQRNLINGYKTNYELISNLNKNYLNEDRKYIKAIHDREISDNLYRKKLYKERNKYSDQLDKFHIQKKENEIKSRSPLSFTEGNVKTENNININDDDDENPIINKLENEALEDNNNQEEEKKEEVAA